MHTCDDSARKMKHACVLLVCSLILLLSLVTVQGDGDETVHQVKIVEVYVYSDPGCEYVVLENWGSDVSLEGWKLTNGRASVYMPDRVFGAGERLILAEDQEGYYEIWQEYPDHTWSDGDLEREGYFRLRDTGDDVILKNDQSIIDVFCYGDGDHSVDGWEGSRYGNMGRGQFAKRRSQDTNTVHDWTWTRRWRVGQSNFTTMTTDANSATVFVSPDSSHDAMMQFLDDVESDLVVSAYLLSEPGITEKLSWLSREGIDVRILMEGSPVGGMPDRVRYSLNSIKEAGARISLLRAGEYSPHNFFHCKYMVADNSSVLISSENFVTTGYPEEGRRGNRGWGIILESDSLADHFTDIYLWDLHYAHDYRIYEAEPGDTTVPKPNYRAEYPSEEIVGGISVTTVFSPDNSMSKNTILGMIDDAKDSIYVQQFYIHHWGEDENPYVEALIDAAERGVRVKISLDSTWYNLGGEWNDNDHTVDRLNLISSERNLPLEARLLDQGHGLEKIHNKGMIVDEDKVLISSINWNSNSVLQNREAGVIVEGVGSYYTEIFMNDWKYDVISPIADAGRDISVEVGSVVRFYGGYSWDDQGIVSYRWDLTGDGVFESSGKTVSRVFREPGEYTISLKVEDAAGNTDVSKTLVNVNEPEVAEMMDGDSAFSKTFLVLTIIGIATLIYVKYRR